MLVGEDHIECLVADQSEKFIPVPVDAKRVGQGQRHIAPSAMSDVGRFHKRLLCGWRIPQISLEICDAGSADQFGINIVGGQILACSQIGAHGAFAIWRDHHKTARGRGPFGRRRCAKVNPNRANVMSEGLASLIVAHFPYESCAHAKRSCADNRICG